MGVRSAERRDGISSGARSRTGQHGTRLVSSLAVGVVVFLMLGVGLEVANQKVKQTLLDLLSLLP
jgi:hypothetical protein